MKACEQGCFTDISTGARLYVGGRLGRHPRLAMLISEVATAEAAIRKIDARIQKFLAKAKIGTRFADFIAGR